MQTYYISLYRRCVRCPSCAHVEDKVIDSRSVEEGACIRRRRECLSCGNRFTTFERFEDFPLIVVKRTGKKVPYDSKKIESGVRSALKGRPVTDEKILSLTNQVEDELRATGPEVTSEQIGLCVLEQLRVLDKVAYVRFASVYKDFDDPADFQREIRLLKKTFAK